MTDIFIFNDLQCTFLERGSEEKYSRQFLVVTQRPATGTPTLAHTGTVVSTGAAPLRRCPINKEVLTSDSVYAPSSEVVSHPQGGLRNVPPPADHALPT